MDDLKARKLAEKLGLFITGTLGVLLQAKREDYIPSLKEVLNQIQQTDFRLSERLITAALAQVGESSVNE